MNAQDLTAALVDVYARLRRGMLTDTATRREASGFFSSLRELSAEVKARPGSKKPEERTRFELAYIPGAYADVELERLTPDFKPWAESAKTAQEARLTPEDVELLEVNALARARRGEITEGTARAEAYILKAIRFGLVLAPMAGGVTWGDVRQAQNEDVTKSITILHHVPDEKEPVAGPVVTFIHGFPVAGERNEEAPPWPIRFAGKVTGYYVPKGWTKPQGEEFTAMLTRLQAAGDRAE